ncbi:hypothetical protein K504DRAFT_535368 [Pleomassaria siparia CBS 279.74]|uniref:C2H2-type domain-containing protein n=1 Tax=Pleomassaria siparia CBS 279.74 TaxID=1314801 RepID=A0A6G1K5K3_9PLEO|nr:hypothetical protein K504DRAFT_535368 [Pleomassaria siparia CBS 279.74]
MMERQPGFTATGYTFQRHGCASSSYSRGYGSQIRAANGKMRDLEYDEFGRHYPLTPHSPPPGLLVRPRDDHELPWYTGGPGLGSQHGASLKEHASSILLPPTTICATGNLPPLTREYEKPGLSSSKEETRLFGNLSVESGYSCPRHFDPDCPYTVALEQNVRGVTNVAQPSPFTTQTQHSEPFMHAKGFPLDQEYARNHHSFRHDPDHSSGDSFRFYAPGAAYARTTADDAQQIVTCSDTQFLQPHGFSPMHQSNTKPEFYNNTRLFNPANMDVAKTTHASSQDGIMAVKYTETLNKEDKKEEPQRLPCTECPEVFHGVWAQGNLLRHMRSQHANIILKCDVCQKNMKRGDALLKHKRERHPELGIPEPVRRKKSDGSQKGSSSFGAVIS